MPKVTLNKSTKIKGKGFVLAGVETEVSAAEAKQLEKDGFIGEAKKSANPTNEKEIKELVAKVADLEKQIEESGSDEELKKQIETLTAEAAEKDKQIETLTAEAAEKDKQIETLTAEAAKQKAKKK